ncbi:MAG: flagellar type III secretion system pore protein FliP [Deltaproteobacteria bacterium]|nr:flagellar type III secretion system pore protein FliP [Deltaproteobacteria bacterium]
MNQTLLPLLTQTVKGTEVASVIEITFLLTLLSIGPAILITLTSFTRIVVVLSFLRQAMGTQQAPSNQIIIALALFLSLYVMAPVWQQVESAALMPYLQHQVSAQDALVRAWEPLREFLLRQTRKTDMALFVQMQREREGTGRPPTAAVNEQPAVDSGHGPAEVAAAALIPAFVISELKTAFQIAFLVYVPFLVLDLVVASILMSMGMMFLPPALISLPFKLVLFVLVDGWNLLVGSLVRSFV